MTGPSGVAELKKILSDDLGALLAEHHRQLHEQVSLWMDSKDVVLEHISRNLVEGAPPMDRPLSLEQGAAAARPATPQSSNDHGLRQISRSGSDLADQDGTDTEWQARHASKDFVRRRMARSYSDYMEGTRKEAVKASLSMVPQESVRSEPESPPSTMRSRVRACMASTACTHFSCMVILVYLVTMGLEVDGVGNGALLHVQTACSIAFLFELLVRIYAEGSAFFCGEDMQCNLLDFALVLFSLFEMGVKHGHPHQIDCNLLDLALVTSLFERAVTAVSSDASDEAALDSMMMLRVLRVVRVIRVIRVVRLLRFFRPLRLLVRSIYSTLKSMIYIIALLGGIMYVFGVVFAQAARDSPSESMSWHFGSVYTSVLTLFKCVTSGISWELVYQPLHATNWLYGALFVSYVAFTQLAVLNIMTGQFCQSAIESCNDDDEEVISAHMADKRFCMSRLRSIFANLSSDRDVLTLEDLEQSLTDDRLVAFLQSLGVKVTDAWTLFTLLDEDQQHCIDLERFVEGCLRLRGTATTIGLRSLAHEVRWLSQNQTERLQEIRGGLLGFYQPHSGPVRGDHDVGA